MTDQYSPQAQAQASTDVGLRNFMLGTYRYMTMAMAVTATVAFFGGQFLMANPQYMSVLRNPLIIIGFIFAIPFLFGSVGRKLPTMSKGSVVTFLFGFAAFLGVFMSAITVFYPGPVIAKIFFMTVAMFAGLSLFGYTTERNLSAFIKYAIAAFMGYVAISVLGLVFPSLRPTGPLDIIINVIALGAIAMITAWETQMLKRIYYGTAGNPAMLDKMAAFGAASLLLAFVNMFQILLSLFGRD